MWGSERPSKLYLKYEPIRLDLLPVDSDILHFDAANESEFNDASSIAGTIAGATDIEH